MLAFGCIKIGVQVSGFGIYGGYMKLHLTNAEVGLRPVGAIEAYAPEGMRKDGVAALSHSS